MGVITQIRQNKTNGGRCSVFVDDEFFAACPIDVALALGLRKGLEMTTSLERRLRSEDRRMVLRQKAYRFATYKPRTEKNVVDFLQKAEATPEETDNVLSWLREFRLVDDQAYAERFLVASRERKPLSAMMARRTLLGKGVPEQVVDDAVGLLYTADDALEGARTVARKKLRMLASLPVRAQEEKLVRFLQYRGYGWDVIKKVIADVSAGTLLILVVVACACAQVQAQVDTSCTKKRLPDAINRYQPTTMPVLGPEGELYLDRKYHPENSDGSKDPDEVWVSFSKRSQWSDVQLADLRVYDTVRKNYVYAQVCFGMSLDGLHALVAGPFIHGSGAMSLAFLNRETIKAPFTTYGIIIPNLGKNFFATASEDMGAIIVAMELADGKGDLDLYAITLDMCTGLSDIKPLGGGINTAAFEGAPWIACDNRTLYFASAGRDDRRGKADLYMTRRLDDTWLRWSDPVNLGSCINTTEDETSISLPCGQARAYITSWDPDVDRPGVYTVELPSTMLPLRMVDATITVRDALADTAITRAAVRVQRVADAGTCHGHHYPVVDAVLGSAHTTLAPDSSFVLTAVHPHGRYVGIPRSVRTSTSALRETITMVSTEKPLLSIWFAKGDTTLTPESHAALEKLRSAIGTSTLSYLAVRGYCDGSGSLSVNSVISRARARAVAEQCTIFVPDGSIQRIAINGMGVEKVNGSAVATDTPESRRVDIYAIAK